MSSEVFNPNPIVFSTTKSSARRKPSSSSHSLWIADKAESDYGSDEVEVIDGEEVFGLYRALIPTSLLTPLFVFWALQNSFDRLVTQNIVP